VLDPYNQGRTTRSVLQEFAGQLLRFSCSAGSAYWIVTMALPEDEE
jgi:hypothetical protein